MRTYPSTSDDGSIKAFEISSSYFWSLGDMRRTLESVNGVSEVRRNWFNDDRYSFFYQGRACVVNEPYGDNSRYWIGPTELEPALDLGPVHDAFRKFRLVLTFDAEFRE